MYIAKNLLKYLINMKIFKNIYVKYFLIFKKIVYNCKKLLLLINYVNLI